MVKNTVRVHTCFQAVKGVPREKCNCRKRLTVEDAAMEVNHGLAEYVIVKFVHLEVSEACPICTPKEANVKFCTFCKNSGLVKVKKSEPVRGRDIIRSMSIRGRTPRTQTIELAHMERATEGNNREQQRSKAYGEMSQIVLAELGAELRDAKTGEILIPGRPEPLDDPKTGTGRNYDYGRSL